MAKLKKGFRILIIVSTGLVCFFGVAFIVFYVYFTSHKKELIQKASAEISAKLEANVKIKDAGISWFATFPHITIDLEDITVIDTTYASNAQTFLTASKLYFDFNLLKLLKGQLHINWVQLNDGTINLQRDSLGKSNLHILDILPKKITHEDTSAKTLFNFLSLNNIRILFCDKGEYKKYDLLIRKIECKSDVRDTVIRYEVNLDVHINYLGLNMQDGTYGRNKDLGGEFKLNYNPKNQVLSLHKITLTLNKEPVVADGFFCLDTAKHFHLNLSAPAINFENAATSALEKTQPLLKMIKVEKPVSLEMDIYGNTKFLSVPDVHMTITVLNNTISTPGGVFSKCSLVATYIDDINKLRPLVDLNTQYVDENSRFSISNLAAIWNGNSMVYSHAFVITNLVHPIVHLELAADLSLPDMDSLIQSNDFSLQGGNAKASLVYDGPMNDSARIAPDVVGTIVLRNANVLYIPRNIDLKNGNAVLRFNHTDFSIESLSGKVGSSVISVSSKVNSFAPLFEHNRPLNLRWNISSSKIDLNEWIPLINSRKVVKRASIKEQQKLLTGISDVLDRFTDLCNINAIFSVKEIDYGHFEGDNLYADLALSDANGWEIKKASMNEGKGTIYVSGTLEEDNDNQHFVTLSTTLSNVDLSKTFYGFNNFGMKSFNYTNLKGQLNSQAKIKLTLDGKDNIVPGSLKGTLTFQVYNGELIDFHPIEDVCKKIFPARDFKDIQFAELRDNVTISGNVIDVKRMEIASSVLHLYVEGNYGLNGAKTDLAIQVPLNNISKQQVETRFFDANTKVKNGLSIYVHATQEGTGDYNFKYSFSGKPVKTSNPVTPSGQDSVKVVP
jgi:hypothetical protein